MAATKAGVDSQSADFNSDDLEFDDSDLPLSPTESIVPFNGTVINQEQITAYVSPDDMELDDETLVTQVMSDEIPDVEFMHNYLTANELDEKKRKEFRDYIDGLDAEALQALWESMKGTYGASPEVITASDLVGRRIEAVENSQSLRLRDTAVDTELARMGTIASQLQRTLRISMSDAPLNSFRVDHLAGYIRKLQRDLSMMNSSVLSMAEMLLIGHSDENETVEMAINPERIAKICAIVGHSAKGWARVYTSAKDDRVKLLAEIESFKSNVKLLNEAVASSQRELQIERARIEAMTLRATSYFIGNYSGFFITTVNKQDDDEDWYRIGPYNLRLTQERSEAFVHDDIEVLRKVLDGVLEWSKKNPRVRKLFREANVRPDTLFIFGESLVKVG